MTEAYQKDVDWMLIREMLKLTPEERSRSLMELSRFAAELQAAAKRLRVGSNDGLQIATEESELPCNPLPN